MASKLSTPVIDKLLSTLRNDLDKHTLKQPEKRKTLERVKVLGREPRNAAHLYTKQNMGTLSQYGLHGPRQEREVLREALRCIANGMLLHPPSRQDFVDLGHAETLILKFGSVTEVDDEFLYSRILFLLTYETDLDYARLMVDQKLHESITQCLKRHSSSSAERQKSSKPRPQMEGMALSETLKLIFNILHKHPSEAYRYNDCVEYTVNLLLNENPLPQPPIELPLSDTINALINLDLETANQDILFPDSDPPRLTNRLFDILDAAIKFYPVQSVDTSASPLLALLNKLTLTAPETVKNSMRTRLFPSDDERTKPLGQADTLPARLLRLSTSGHTPQLRESIPSLLFELCDKDAEKFVRAVGYGYASGYLTNHKIPVPLRYRSASVGSEANGEGSSAATTATGGGERTERRGRASEDKVNFVTGQYLAHEPEPSGPLMTEEEKMREAERLFVLFERLKKTGVMNVKNPVEEAIDSGRFEELD